MHKITTVLLLIIASSTQAQNVLTPEQLWKFGRVSGTGISKDGKYNHKEMKTILQELDLVWQQ